ncbi:MAG: nitroreductase family protein [Chloroflexi bacterium]|nr:nitroreductase family protein [Chloroflexota bacterium]
MEYNDLADLIKSRHSIRRWQDKKVSEKLLLEAIELATWAPNGGNQQNWRFYIIVNKDIINAIADAVQASANEISSWEQPSTVISTTGRAAGFFRSAPAAIAVAASQYQSGVDRILEAREQTNPRAKQIRQWRNLADSRIQSVSAAIAYLLLILHQRGLGTVWMTGPMQAKGEIEKILKVPAEMDIVAFIPVGYPDETPVIRGRRPVGEVTEIVR